LKRLFFFATPRDIVPVLRRISKDRKLQFIEAGNRTDPDFPTYLDPENIPEPGVATHETGSLSRTYVICPRETELKIQTFVSAEGVRRWHLYNALNENSVDLVMAGLWKDMLLPGNVSTLHETSGAQQIMRAFKAALRAEGYTKLKMWWLGKEAFESLKSGKRLSTTAEQSPADYDLRWPAEGSD
jgi:hypothetical protein